MSSPRERLNWVPNPFPPPGMIPFENAKEMLLRGDIIRYEIEPNRQRFYNKNTIFTLYARDGTTYLTSGIYDQQNNQIFQPILEY